MTISHPCTPNELPCIHFRHQFQLFHLSAHLISNPPPRISPCLGLSQGLLVRSFFHLALPVEPSPSPPPFNELRHAHALRTSRATLPHAPPFCLTGSSTFCLPSFVYVPPTPPLLKSIFIFFLAHSSPHPGPTSSPRATTIPIWTALTASPPLHWVS